MLRWLVAAMLVFGSSASVQMVAWAGMLSVRTVEQGWTTAVGTTFDGDHPCSLCHAAASLRRAESGAAPGQRAPGDLPPAGKPVKLFDVPMAAPIDLACRPGPDGAMIAAMPPLERAAQFNPAPEPPPPRS